METHIFKKRKKNNWVSQKIRFIGEAEASILQLLHGAIVFLYAVDVFSDIPTGNIMLNSDYFILPPG